MRKKKMKKKKINKNTKKYLLKLSKRERNKNDKEWRESVLKIFDYKCAICGDNKIKHVHHIIPRENKEYRNNINNGIVLCPLHHKYSYNISPHKNPLAFFIWLEKNRFEQYNYLKIELEKIITLINNKIDNIEYHE